MRKWTIALLIALPLLANQNAKVILSRVDSVMNAPKDREMKMIMILIDKHGEKSIREGESYQKGDSYRLIRFTKPADQRGIAFLSLPHDVMYVYFPAFKKKSEESPPTLKIPHLQEPISHMTTSLLSNIQRITTPLY